MLFLRLPQIEAFESLIHAWTQTSVGLGINACVLSRFGVGVVALANRRLPSPKPFFL